MGRKRRRSRHARALERAHREEGAALGVPLDLDPEAAAPLDLDAEPSAPLDLDDDLEEDAGKPDVEGLIAAATAGAPEAGEVPEEPPIDLDADVEPAEAAAPTAAAPPPEPRPGDGPNPDDGARGTARPAAAERAAPPIAPAASAARRPAPLPDAAAAREAVSSPELRSRLLAEALAHAEHQDARYRVPFSDRLRIRRRKTALALLLLLLAGVVRVLPPGWASPDPPAPVEGAVRERDLRVALLLQAQQVEAYRVAHQALPDSLGALAAALPGVRYVRSGNRAYQLVAYLPDGGALVYDSVDPSPEFEGLPHPWQVREEGS